MSSVSVLLGESGAWTWLGSALAGAAGPPQLTGTGVLGSGSSNHIDLAGSNPSSPATLVFGLSQLNAPFKGGVLVPDPLMLLPFTTSGAGTLSLPFTLPAVPPGLDMIFQYWIQDAAASKGFAASNALKGITS
jgi:hypothetical protein